MVSDTSTKCDACGGIVDHRSRVVRQQGHRTMRECAFCGHIQPCDEEKISKQNWAYLEFLEKLMRSRHVEVGDGMKAKWLRDAIAEQGYVKESQLGEFRRLERKYCTQI